MAAPNIINVTSIYGRTATANLSTTNATSVVSNAASSGKVFKINTLIVSNVDGTTAYPVTINYYSAAGLSGTATEIGSTITVPADSSLVVIDKGYPIYLEEDKSIGAIAGTANKLKVICSYEEIT
jgi:hypothetical protein